MSFFYHELIQLEYIMILLVFFFRFKSLSFILPELSHSSSLIGCELLQIKSTDGFFQSGLFWNAES